MTNSQQPLTADSHEVERVISRFYRSVVSVAADEYRSWALASIKTVIPHDYALWGSGVWESRRFHNLTLNDLPPEYVRAIERSADQNPLVKRLIKLPPGTPARMEDATDDASYFASEFYRNTFAPFGIERTMSIVHLDKRSGVYSLVSLYRNDRNKPFTDDEMRIQKRLVFHLFNAASHAFFIHLTRTHRDRPAGAAAAVVDRRGTFHDAQPRFLDALDAHYPNRSGPTSGARAGSLPFPLPEPGEICQVGPRGELYMSAETMGDLFVVHLWPAGPLDRLTAREREIVLAVAHGLSFKQAARKIGVAPSTVANHLYRIYRKLNVNSRTELANLVHVEPPEV